MLKIRYDYHLFSLLKFVGAAILNWWRHTSVAAIVSQQNFVYEKQLSNCITSWNPRWRRPRNLKAKNTSILFCPTLIYCFHDFQRNFKVDCIFNNLTLICGLERIREKTENDISCRLLNDSRWVYLILQLLRTYQELARFYRLSPHQATLDVCWNLFFCLNRQYLVHYQLSDAVLVSESCHPHTDWGHSHLHPLK